MSCGSSNTYTTQRPRIHECLGRRQKMQASKQMYVKLQGKPIQNEITVHTVSAPGRNATSGASLAVWLDHCRRSHHTLPRSSSAGALVPFAGSICK